MGRKKNKKQHHAGKQLKNLLKRKQPHPTSFSHPTPNSTPTFTQKYQQKIEQSSLAELMYLKGLHQKQDQVVTEKIKSY